MIEQACQSPLEPIARGARVLIVGGSTRAAAWSAVRAGLRPICADLFADLDTHQIAEIVCVRDFPTSLPEDVARVRADGWFYTGALENHPKIIEQMLRPDATYGPLWGTPPPALRWVRDPFWLAKTLRAAELPALDAIPQSSPPPADGTWLQKPLASAGGRAIRIWDRYAAAKGFREPHYFQRRATGESCSAVFRARDGHVEWLGSTQQLIHFEASCASIPFAYCGSFGPIDQPGGAVSLSMESRNTVTRIAQTLAGACELHGLFGIDFLLDGDCVWMTELNPRYTASIEVLELARRQSLLGVADSVGKLQTGANSGEGEAPVEPRRVDGSLDSAARREPRPPDLRQRLVQSHFNQPNDSLADSGTLSKERPAFVVKAILYARHSFSAPDLTHLLHCESLWDMPRLADVPKAGTVIEAGWPICTVFAKGFSTHQCLSDLKTRCNEVRSYCGEMDDTAVL
jgi:uncharacterized protein